MNNKGFTLIELVAVFVVLSVIILITVPIVTKTLNKSLENLELKDSEAYLRAIKLSISNYELEGNVLDDGIYSIIDNGDICVSKNSNDSCKTKLTVHIPKNNNYPIDGEINIKDGEIYSYYFDYEDGLYISNGEKKPVCALVEGTSNQIGSKYLCRVKNKMEEGYENGYYFYVISHNEDGTTNLIMDRNINSIGKVEDEHFPWHNNSRSNINGPTTLIRTLYNATIDWINVEPLNYIYNDREKADCNLNNCYDSFIAKNGIVTITQMSGNKVVIGSLEEPVRARLPVYIQKSIDTEVAAQNDNNAYLYENLYYNNEYGYWTLSSAYQYFLAYGVHNSGVISSANINGSTFGIRPVITVRL